MNDDNVRTLCPCCVGVYYDAGFNPVQIDNQTIKEPCDICGKPGFEYVIRDVKSSEVKLNDREKGKTCKQG